MPYSERTAILTRPQSFPDLSFVVQDLFPPATLNGDSQLATNVQFQQHNFFEPQPITTAQAYFMKHSLHNHSDTECIKILQALVPALDKAGPRTPLLINEGVIPAKGEAMPRHQELTLRRGDMCMMVTLSAKERSRTQFQQLLSAADPRFEVGNPSALTNPANLVSNILDCEYLWKYCYKTHRSSSAGVLSFQIVIWRSRSGYGG